MQCRGWQCFQKRSRRKKQVFSEKMKKDWGKGAAESCQDAYGEAITMNCRKKKVADVIKDTKPAKRSSAQTQPKDRRQL